MPRIACKYHCSLCSTADVLSFPLLPDFFFIPPLQCGHPSPSYPSSFSLHHPLAAISKELTWPWSKMPAPSEAGKFGREAGQISVSFGPIYFRLGTVNSCCFGAGSLGTRLHDGAVPGSCPSVLELGWGGSSCSAGFPTVTTLCHGLGTAEAALWN